MKIICVLKSGKFYNEEYVTKLYNGIKRNITYLFDFICLTDLDPWEADYIIYPLKNNWIKWWSKIEMFNFTGPVITMDLDTVIVNDINPLIDLCYSLKENQFSLLRKFIKTHLMQTGVMMWNGNWKEIYNMFNYKEARKLYYGDDQYTYQTLLNLNAELVPIQDHINGLYSYKRHVLKNKEKLPDDTRIVIFHGNPRPHQISNEWMKKYWI